MSPSRTSVRVIDIIILLIILVTKELSLFNPGLTESNELGIVLCPLPV